MASPVIKIKRSSVQNNAPTAAQLELGELALNTYDGKLFTEINDGTVSIVEIGGHLKHLAVSGISTFTGNIDANGALDVDGATTLDALTVAESATFSDDVTFTGVSYNVVWDKSDDALEFPENAKVKFGDTLSIYKSSSHAIIDNTYEAGSYLRLGSGNGIILGSPLSDNQVMIRGYVNGAAELYHSNNKKLNTTSTGVNITGGITGAEYLNLSATSPSIDFIDTNHNSDFMLQNANGVFKLYDSTNGADRWTVASDGTFDVNGSLVANNGLDVTGNMTVSGSVTGGLDVVGHTEVDNLKSVGIATFSNNAIHANIYSTGISTISGFRFPTSDGDEDQALVTDGNGSLSFKTLSGGGSAAGAATTISSGITTATQGQTVFSTPHPHNDGTNTYSAQVFVNGIKQRPQGAGSTKDFTTSSNSTITFEEGITAGSEVVTVVYFGHTIDEEYFTATQGQVLFPLSGSLSAQKNFRVFVNGVKQRVGSDFGVAAPVTLVQPCAEGAHVEIVCDNAEDAFVATDQQTNFTPTSTDISEDNMQVYVNGVQLFKGLDYSIGSPSVTFTDATGLTVGDEVDVCIRRTA